MQYSCASVKDCAQLRRDIEDHFARCIHALEVRQSVLLNQLDIIQERRSM